MATCHFRNEPCQLDILILVDTHRLADHKHRIVPSILVLKLGGLVELGKKLAVRIWCCLLDL
jgi:hypothetical protein